MTSKKKPYVAINMKARHAALAETWAKFPEASEFFHSTWVAKKKEHAPAKEVAPTSS